MKKRITIKSGDGQSLTVTRTGQSIDLTMEDGGGVRVAFAVDLDQARRIEHVLRMMVADAVIGRDKAEARSRKEKP